jgi:hypothetical protein
MGGMKWNRAAKIIGVSEVSQGELRSVGRFVICGISEVGATGYNEKCLIGRKLGTAFTSPLGSVLSHLQPRLNRARHGSLIVAESISVKHCSALLCMNLVFA